MVQDWDRVERSAKKLADRLVGRRNKILQLLTEHETWDTARDEFKRAVKTLNGLRREWPYIERADPSLTVSSFLPVNQPLYSLVLFGAVPALIAAHVAVRPSAVTATLVDRLWQLVSIPELQERLTIHSVNRRGFVREHARYSDLVVLTGKHETARAVMKMPGRPPVFAFNGSGVNPIIVTADARVEDAAAGIIGSAMYNSGQDCAAPKCVFVHVSVADSLIDLLRARLSQLQVGPPADPRSDIGPVARRESLYSFTDFVLRRNGNILTGGGIDVSSMLIQPTLAVSELTDNFSYPELYAPVVNLATFADEQTVVALTASDRYQRHAMYATTYGTWRSGIRRTEVLPEKTVLEHEDGNVPYGGLGAEASFIKLPGAPPKPGPVLISDALATAGRSRHRD